jgi:hypothetical protein
MDASGADLPTDAIAARDRGLGDWIRDYSNDRACNTAVHRIFADLAHRPGWLDAHLDLVEANDSGFRDLASHHMWRLVLEFLSTRDGPVRCLEIGVFRSQIVSLWALVGAQLGFAVDITAIGPYWHAPPELASDRLSSKNPRNVSPLNRGDSAAASAASSDFVEDCKRIFSRFGLDFCDVEAVRGFSSDEAILSSLAGRSFDLIYINGAHSEASARQDVVNFSSKVARGGLLVMGHASLSLEMDVAYRGLPVSSKAADGLSFLGFRNILNVGHNRVFRQV